MTLSMDAIVFGFGHFQGPKSTLSFGGDGAAMEITPRARDALNELLAEGYAVASDPTDSIPNREYYRGTAKEPSISALAKESGYNPFGDCERWATFKKKAATD